MLMVLTIIANFAVFVTAFNPGHYSCFENNFCIEFLLKFKSGVHVRFTFRAQKATLFAEFVGLILYLILSMEILRLARFGFWPKMFFIEIKLRNEL